MKKIILLIIMLISTVYFLNIASKQYESIDTNYDDLAQLETQRSDILLKLSNLEKEYTLKTKGTAYNFIMFTDFNTKYYKEIVNSMSAKGYYATLVLSEDNFPSMDNYLSIKQFNNLIKNGWNYCILYEDDTQFERLCKLLEINNMKTDTVYFKEGTYNQSIDRRLKTLGFSGVIHHGENGMSLYTDELDNGIWHIGCTGIMSNEPRYKFLDSIEQNGTLAFSIGFKNEGEMYSYRVLSSLMDNFDEYVSTNQLTVTCVERANNIKNQIDDNYTKNMREYESKKENLNKELQTIEQQIEVLEDEQ